METPILESFYDYGLLSNVLFLKEQIISYKFLEITASILFPRTLF